MELPCAKSSALRTGKGPLSVVSHLLALRPHGLYWVLARREGGGRKKEGGRIFSPHEAPTFMTSYKPNYLQKTPCANTTTLWDWDFNIQILRGHSVHNTAQANSAIVKLRIDFISAFATSLNYNYWCNTNYNIINMIEISVKYYKSYNIQKSFPMQKKIAKFLEVTVFNFYFSPKCGFVTYLIFINS